LVREFSAATPYDMPGESEGTLGMTNGDIPHGERFSLVYLERGAPQQDSERMRQRIGHFLRDCLPADTAPKITQRLRIDMGLVVQYRQYTGYNWPDFLRELALKDFLDLITIVFRQLAFVRPDRYKPPMSIAWHVFVSRVFQEENVGYRLDDQGGVHPFIDEEFERSRVAALACLAGERYKPVAGAFDDAHQRLEAGDTKGAIRLVFEALEIQTKLMVDCRNLASAVVRDRLKPIAASAYAGDPTTAAVADKLLDSFCAWIDGMHFYRHGHKEATEPPLGIAVQILSTGAAYLRWLVELDQARNAR
jgi:hypothetical protein